MVILSLSVIHTILGHMHQSQSMIDGLVSSWSENISLWFCLRSPGYGSTQWRTLGLLEAGAIQVPQLQLQCITKWFLLYSSFLILNTSLKFHANSPGTFWRALPTLQKNKRRWQWQTYQLTN